VGDLTPEQLSYAATGRRRLARPVRRFDGEGHGRRSDACRRYRAALHPAMAWLCQSARRWAPTAGRRLAREAAEEAKALSDKLGRPRPPPLPGSLLLGEGWNWDQPHQVKEVFAALA